MLKYVPHYYSIMGQNKDWVKVWIRKEKYDIINKGLKTKVWKQAGWGGHKNVAQFVDSALANEFELIERVEWQSKARILEEIYFDNRAVLKKEYGIDNIAEFVNVILEGKKELKKLAKL